MIYECIARHLYDCPMWGAFRNLELGQAAVSFWGQITQILDGVSPKRGCSPNSPKRAMHEYGYNYQSTYERMRLGASRRLSAIAPTDTRGSNSFSTLPTETRRRNCVSTASSGVRPQRLTPVFTQQATTVIKSELRATQRNNFTTLA